MSPDALLSNGQPLHSQNLGRASNVKATSREMPDLPDLRWAGCLRVRYVPRKAYHGWSSQTSKALSSGNPTCNMQMRNPQCIDRCFSHLTCYQTSLYIHIITMHRADFPWISQPCLMGPAWQSPNVGALGSGQCQTSQHTNCGAKNTSDGKDSESSTWLGKSHWVDPKDCKRRKPNVGSGWRTWQEALKSGLAHQMSPAVKNLSCG